MNGEAEIVKDTTIYQAFASTGDQFILKGLYFKAIHCYTEALKDNPTDRRVLLTRCKAYLYVGDTTHALIDANIVLEKYPDSAIALGLKVEILYTQSEFESALILSHRAHHLYPLSSEFRRAIHKIEEAVNNSVSRARRLKFKGRDSRIDKILDTNNRTRTPNPKVGQDSLEELFGDHTFLANLLKSENTKRHPNTHIIGLVDECFCFLGRRSEFWRQQKACQKRNCIADHKPTKIVRPSEMKIKH